MQGFHLASNLKRLVEMIISHCDQQFIIREYRDINNTPAGL